MKTQELLNRLNILRKGSSDFVVVEGFHAVKHAIRFNAKIEQIYLSQDAIISGLGETVRVDEIITQIESLAIKLSKEDFRCVAPQAYRTGVFAIVSKPSHTLASIPENGGYIVVLENSRDLNNIGAVVRVCAARDVAALVITGENSPWHASALRAGAGLHWAIPVIHTEMSEVLGISSARQIYACTDEGLDMYSEMSDPSAVLIFGTERDGITREIRNRADKKIAIPMKDGVSSMNLATSVSAILFARPL